MVLYGLDIKGSRENNIFSRYILEYGIEDIGSDEEDINED